MLTVTDSKFDWRNIPLKDCLDGNAMDTYFTAKVYCKLLSEVQDKGLEHLYDKVIAPLTTIFRDIELEGVLIDTDRLDELEVELKVKVEEIEEVLIDFPQIRGEPNLGSALDLSRILFSLEKRKTENGTSDWFQIEDDDEEEGFGLFPFLYTKKGAPSTNEEAISALHGLVVEEHVKRGLSGK